MKPPRLIAITDFQTQGNYATLMRVQTLFNHSHPGTVLLQLRDRELPTARLASLGKVLRKLSRDFGHRFAINDRLDLARLLDVDAVHLGERSVSVQDARRLLPEVPVYAAVHEPKAALASSADAVVLAPVCAPRKGAAALGLDALAELATALRKRPGAPLLYALGGVTAKHAAACLEAGATGVAAQGAIWDDDAWQELCVALEIAC